MKTSFAGTSRRQFLTLLIVTALVGMATGLAAMLPVGNLRPDAFNAEITYRFNDFENYGWHRAEGTLASIHPVYAAAIGANKTIPVLLVTLGHILTGNDVVGRLTVLLAFFALYGIAAPLFVFALTRNRTAAVLTALAMAALDWKELIYGYNNSPLFGRFATTLFILELALTMLGKRKSVALVWTIHLLTHPTTAVAWLLPLLAFALLLDSKRWPYLSERKWQYGVIAAAPFALAAAIMVAQKTGVLFSGVDEQAYWSIVRVRMLHTLFLHTERSFVLILYVQLCFCLAVLGWSSQGEPRLNLLNRIVSAFGFGMLAISLAFVETEISVSVAALLPLRYADVMFVVLIFNLVSILAGQRSSSWGCRFSAAVIFALLLVGHRVNPLFAIGIWAFGLAMAERGTSLQGIAVRLIGLAILNVAAVALLPTADNSYSSWYLPPWTNSAPAAAVLSALGSLDIAAINVKYAMLFASDTAVVLLALMAGIMLGQTIWARGALVLATAFAVLPVGARILHYPWRAAGSELPIAVGMHASEKDPSAELMRWMQAEIPRGAGVLGSPNLFFRLKLAARMSVDDDLLSLVPYVPGTSASVVDEYRRLYSIDIVALANHRGRIGNAFDENAWITARDRVLSGQIADFKWIVEEVSVPPAKAVIKFENSRFRVYAPR